MSRQTKRERLAVILAELQGMPSADPERAHGRADRLLLDALRILGRADLADAYDQLVHRCPWWAHA